jgi:heme exporter protein A
VGLDRLQTAAMILALDIDRLTCIRGGRVVFENLSLSLAPGELLAVEGPNGAGKTSLLRLIAGFLAPAAGTIRLRMDTAVCDRGEERGLASGWLGHRDAVKPQLTVAENLAFWARLYGGEANAMLAAVGLAELAHRPAQHLSAGQLKRLALARLVMTGRPLWLLDEPLAALDGGGRALLGTLLAAHCQTGGIAIAASHEPLGLDGKLLQLGRLRLGAP